MGNLPNPVTQDVIIDLGFIKDTKIPMHVFDRYSLSCGVAYNRMFRELVQLFTGKPLNMNWDYELTHKGSVKLVALSDAVDKGDPEYKEFQSRFRAIVGRCGAGVGAAKKHGQRSITIQVMTEWKDRHGLDVTPAVANNAAKAVFKRGLDKETLNRHFGTPGRTAANKSRVFTHAQQRTMYDSCKVELRELNEIFSKYTFEIRMENAFQWSRVWGSWRSGTLNIPQ